MKREREYWSYIVNDRGIDLEEKGPTLDLADFCQSFYPSLSVMETGSREGCCDVCREEKRWKQRRSFLGLKVLKWEAAKGTG